MNRKERTAIIHEKLAFDESPLSCRCDSLYPPTPWNTNPRDIDGTPGPYEDAVQNTPLFEENDPDTFLGFDFMHVVRSFGPCLPCGVHIAPGNGETLKEIHMPPALMGLARH